MIRFDKISKVYGAVKVLTELDLHIGKGELVALIGPSGCGKTTTLRMINRLIEPSSGTIKIHGQDISNTNPVELRRGIGYVIQQIGLLPHLSIGKNIGLVPKLKGWKDADYTERVNELMHMVGLDPKVFRNRFPSELSGGQQQRIGVIRALAAEPPIILMDEPFSALDPISREQLQEELVRLQKEIQKTIVFVTHDIDEALKISDRIAIMNAGRIIQLDTPENILKYPANEFVRGFIGEKRLGAAAAGASGNGIVSQVEAMMIQPITKLYEEHRIADALSVAKSSKEEAFLVYDGDRGVAGVISLAELERNAGRGNETICTIMHKPLLCVEADSSWREASERLMESQVSGLPVMKHGKVIGVVTQTSILRGLSKMSG
ncbi:betaine/proline/choline family ABC transporter ATP-binding protein [Paenibacillus radicis (ex Xue et al. 2023)]|uniref:Quaternary amine transport ATP-binding protein n=1 Tax=Paenibacillus radicis (ex Xue et al. 2023) TaxID=2972489 RepID=A0ABT1YJN1_9BACL|nr:betaine/proline/choline family ABC transporter ATP-binding protein [Paenibacillus radicis (ex Xue et al. 2023)]MCR8632473.1 betaine/proline/choline family ABC transporter ATP-binding protein [Paenibacillus radicis (ex Xue et al. 2023)]